MTTLLIVESPGKIKELRAILGAGFDVAASVGHIRDLPVKEMGVDLDTGHFAPHYVFIPGRRGKAGRTLSGGKQRVADLAAKVKRADQVLLATDPDREGEAIAWHLAQTLHLKHPQRVAYHSITPAAVKAAIAKPHALDMPLVHAQEARRVLDRLVGYTVSPVLSRRLGLRLSAGRVQSPAVRIVVEREQAIAAFEPTDHYTARLTFDADGTPWTAVWDTRPFLKEGERYFTRQDIAAKMAQVRHLTVTAFKDSQAHTAPHAPFTTATMQQAAQNALKFKPKQTMQLAQHLFEAGLITYHRTDTQNLSAEGYAALKRWGGDTIVAKQRRWKAKAGAQEGHEAIRCTHWDKEAAGADEAQRALYDLIRRRAIASQMPDATYAVRTATLVAKITLGGHPVTFIARGRTLLDPGWKRLYGEDDRDGSEPANPVPELAKGQAVTADAGELVTKTTKPPPRYKLSSLIEEMVRLEIGRPATYAAILDNILHRDYIREDRKGFLTPTPTGQALVAALVNQCLFIDLDYTKDLEGELDAIANDKASYEAVVSDAYQHLTQEVANIKPVKIEGIEAVACPTCGAPMQRRKGKRGTFWGCSNYPECHCTAPDVKGKPDLGAARTGGSAEASDYACGACGKPLLHRTGTGKRGAYDFWGCSGYPKCKQTYKSGPDGAPAV